MILSIIIVLDYYRPSPRTHSKSCDHQIYFEYILRGGTNLLVTYIDPPTIYYRTFIRFFQVK